MFVALMVAFGMQWKFLPEESFLESFLSAAMNIMKFLIVLSIIMRLHEWLSDTGKAAFYVAVLFLAIVAWFSKGLAYDDAQKLVNTTRTVLVCILVVQVIIFVFSLWGFAVSSGKEFVSDVTSYFADEKNAASWQPQAEYFQLVWKDLSSCMKYARLGQNFVEVDNEFVQCVSRYVDIPKFTQQGFKVVQGFSKWKQLDTTMYFAINSEPHFNQQQAIKFNEL